MADKVLHDSRTGSTIRMRDLGGGFFAPEVVIASPAGGGSGVPSTASTAELLAVPTQDLLAAADSGVVNVQAYRELFVVAEVTALSGGVGPSVAFVLEREYLPGLWTTLFAPAALTGAGAISRSIGPGQETARSIGRTVRLRWTVSGGATTATGRLYIAAKS
jgi:hypothetical protein